MTRGCCGNACSTRTTLMRRPMFSSIHMRAPPAPQHIAFSPAQRELERRIARELREDGTRRLVLAVVPRQVARLVVDHALERAARRGRGPRR